MDTHRQHEHEQKLPSDEQNTPELTDGSNEAATGLLVVRNNTPRPLSFARSSSRSEEASTMGSFPVEAPAAPPLPEESEAGERGTPTAATSPTLQVSSEHVISERSDASASEFTWLFEYGLEMEEGYLNGPDRLDGQAHTYGPALLKGYQVEGILLRNGQTAVAVSKANSPEHEVWGVLYRIPRRLAEQRGPESAVLDKAHDARLFVATPVIVHEMYRRRMVQCTTYMLSETARRDLASPSQVEAHFDRFDARRLLEVARQQHLPESYLQALATLTGQHPGEPAALLPARIEQNTEPLPVVDTGSQPGQIPALIRSAGAAPTPPGWLFALALYLVGILMATLALAVVQTLGYWNMLFTTDFAPLGAPWYVLLYGLLGGCISCIMTLGRASRPTVPGFVILTWFVRPFLGMVLAALAYLVLSSGLFALNVEPAQRYAICSVIAALAGLCEGWLFFRQQ